MEGGQQIHKHNSLPCVSRLHEYSVLLSFRGPFHGVFNIGYYAATNNRTTDERLTGKNLERGGRDLIEVYTDLHTGTEDNHEEPESG